VNGRVRHCHRHASKAASRQAHQQIAGDSKTRTEKLRLTAAACVWAVVYIGSASHVSVWSLCGAPAAAAARPGNITSIEAVQ